MYEQPYNPYAGNLDIIKGYFKSGKVLTLGILYVISVVMTVVSTLTISTDRLIFQLMQVLSQYGVSIPSEVRSAMMSSTASGVSTASTIVTAIGSSIFPILIAVAFIIMFAKSRSRSELSSPKAGFTIMHVLAIISFIFTIIGVVLIGILYAIIFIGSVTAVNSYASDYTGSAVGVMLLIGAAYIVYAFISISYAASCKNFYRSAKRSITTPELENQGAKAYGVFNILSAVFSVFGLIFNIAIFPYSAGIIFLTGVINLLIYIFTAILAIGYSNYINRQKYSINSNYYGGNGGYAAPPVYNTPHYANPQQNSPYYNAPDDYNNYNQNQYYQDYNAPQNQASYCPNCGAETESNSAFCPNCGTKLN